MASRLSKICRRADILSAISSPCFMVFSARRSLSCVWAVLSCVLDSSCCLAVTPKYQSNATKTSVPTMIPINCSRWLLESLFTLHLHKVRGQLEDDKLLAGIGRVHG